LKNSSRPPSSDGLGKSAPKSLRKRTGRRPGRPKGQPGATMSLADHPDHVIRHEPDCCGRCGAGLGGAPETGMERRQVTEILPVKAEVTEHQMIERECPGCGARTRAQAPDGVNAPVQYGPRAAAMATYLWHGQFLSRDRTAAALGEMFGCAPSPGAIAAMTAKVAGIIAPATDAIARALIAADVAHFDETGFRVAGKLAWVHFASSGKFVLDAVHGKRGRQGMDAAGVLPSFAGIACHDAWAPYDGYDGVAGHALCGAHLLRELTAVTGTGTADNVIWAREAIDALLELNQAADAARAAGHDVIDVEILDKHGRWFRDAADAGIVLNVARRSKLQRKRHALATRMRDRADDYLRFAHDLRVPADNNEAEQVIRMSKHQGLRLHALHARRRDLLRHPLLPGHRHPPRHRLARRPHPGSPGTPLDPRHHVAPAPARQLRYGAALTGPPVTVAACHHVQRALSWACSITRPAPSDSTNSLKPCAPWNASSPAGPPMSSPAPYSPNSP
jgi:transposase